MVASLKVTCAKQIASLDQNLLPKKGVLPEGLRNVILDLHNDLWNYRFVFTRFFRIDFNWIIVNENFCIDWRLSALNCLASHQITGNWSIRLQHEFGILTWPFAHRSYEADNSQAPVTSGKNAFKFAAANGLVEVFTLLWQILDASCQDQLLSNNDGEIAQVAALEATGSEYNLHYAWTLAIRAGWPLALQHYHRQFQIEVVTLLVIIKMKQYFLVDVVFEDTINENLDICQENENLHIDEEFLHLILEIPKRYQRTAYLLAQQLLATLNRKSLVTILEDFCGNNWTAAMDLKVLVEKAFPLPISSAEKILFGHKGF